METLNKDSEIKSNINVDLKNKETTNHSYLRSKIIISFFTGISGFSIFFLFAIFIDFILNIFTPSKTITIDLFTVLIGVAGFILAFLFRFLDNFKN